MTPCPGLQVGAQATDGEGMALRRHVLAVVGAVVAVTVALVISQPQVVTSFVHG